MRRYDGTSWSSIGPGLNYVFHAVSGAGPTEMYAVGGAGASFRYDGATWTQLPSGTGHYDGVSWSPVALPSGTASFLLGVWGSGPTDVYAVGGGTSTSTILHFDGTSWTRLPDPFNTLLRAVWGTGPDDVFVVGLDGLIGHWNGRAWTRMSSGTSAILFGIGGRGPADVTAVGTSGLLLHYDGFAWSEMTRSSTATLLGIGHVGSGLVFAVGDSGTIARQRKACSTSELVCADGEDDDCDGRYDCADADCAAHGSCMAGGACAGAPPIVCGETVTGVTNAGARTFSRYACSDWYATGPEVAHRIDTPTARTVTLSLSNLTRDLDLYVLERAPGGGCDPCNPGCVAASTAAGTAGESITFDAEAGGSYFIVVDGYGAAFGEYTLSVACP